MKVNGSHVLRASKQEVWDALQDPAVLVRTIPGCLEMQETGDHAYRATVEAGIASIKGTYDGEVQLADQDPPHSYTLKAAGSGGPGTIEATATVELADEDAGTRVDYDAHAVIGGAIAGVGQRVVAGVAKRNAATFFSAVDDYLAGELGEPEEAGAEAEAEQAPAAAEAAEEDGAQVFRRPAAAEPTGPAVPDAIPLLAAAVVGAVIALVGVLIGQRRRG